MLKRRDALLGALFGSGYIGLRALATGLPAWYLANPSKANAQELACAINAKENLQYLIVSSSSQGDPLNCNVPGTYEAPEIIHPLAVELTPTAVTLGQRTVNAALPWASTEVGGALAPTTLARTNFFHHLTKLARKDQLAASGNARRFYKQNVAAYGRPSKTGCYAGNAGAHGDFTFEARCAQDGCYFRDVDGLLRDRALGNSYGNVTQHRTDRAFQRAASRLARVVAY